MTKDRAGTWCVRLGFFGSAWVVLVSCMELPEVYLWPVAVSVTAQIVCIAIQLGARPRSLVKRKT